MKKTLGVTHQELSGLRTGRAAAGLVENIKADYYGTMTPLKQLAAIGVPDAKTLEIRPWDKNAFAPIEKAIAASDLKLTPQRQGDLIRLNIPPLTQERRLEMTKIAKRIAEEGRVAVRNVRQETNSKLKAAKEAKALSEDDLRKYTQAVQKLTDQHIAKIDESLAHKEREIVTI
ncbi:MAG: ribosome recycling factor [bacterium]